MRPLPLLLLAAAACRPAAAAAGAQAPANATAQRCTPGLILPVWEPQDDVSSGDVFSRALVYFVSLIYLFIGVSIVADRFMASIEVITSKEKEVTVKKPNGETQIIVVRVWNETVANLTLMALGSSAPEILLSIIEIYAKDFRAGDIGPGTIVGSAAFNLFVIIAICVYVIPDGEVRKIKHLRVFFVTATWSIFAYVWMYLILAVISRGVVEIWEALLTLLFFPATVATAYIADRRMLFYKYMHKDYRINKRGVIVEHEGLEMEKANHTYGADLKQLEEEHVDEAVREFEENRREYIRILRELRKKHPSLDMEQLELMAREEVLNKGPKSRAFYRIQATRKLTGGGNLMRRALQAERRDGTIDLDEARVEDEHVIKVFFDPGHYTVMESIGDFAVTVKREGGDPNQCLLVDYRTEDGSASAGSDYVAVAGTLFFGPGESVKTLSVAVIDDDLFEEDEHFYVRLSGLRLADRDGTPLVTHANGSAGHRSPPPETRLVAPFVATVMILDDDHGGVFTVAEKDVEIVESVGVYSLKVCRWSGARGRVAVPFVTVEGTAKPGKDYVHCEGETIFENNETEQYISIQIIEEDSYEKDVLFYVQLMEPRYLSGPTLDLESKEQNELTEEERIALLGKPKLGEATRAQIRVKESKEFKNTVDKLVQRANASFLVGTSSWKEQFVEAITVSPGDDDDDVGGDHGGKEGEVSGRSEKLPSCGDYIMHFITVFWKVLFAFVPPTDVYNGYPCFVVSILGIGLLTAVIGDVASHFGCTINLHDSVTAISIVALGTSVPDTFASKVAAVQDRYADASVGNVTGSNGVNVFLGIGVAWSMAAIYHWFDGRTFRVEPGNLAFSVTLYCCEAALAIGLMLLRRHRRIGGELGGPRAAKIASALFLFMLWVVYVVVSALEAYGVVPGF